jgi:hypothetical protein
MMRMQLGREDACRLLGDRYIVVVEVIERNGGDLWMRFDRRWQEEVGVWRYAIVLRRSRQRGATFSTISKIIEIRFSGNILISPLSCGGLLRLWKLPVECTILL